MQGLNATVSPLVLDVIQDLSAQQGGGAKNVAGAVAELSRLFTKERTQLKRAYMDDMLLSAAYLQYFVPVNLAKIQILLNEMPPPESERPFSVLDLGSGPGTGTLAVLDWWHQQQRWPQALSVIAVDGSVDALGQATALWDQYCTRLALSARSFQTVEANLEAWMWLDQVGQRAPFDLIIMANSLNELYAEAKDSIETQAGLLAEVLSLLAPHGTLMIVEPALRDTSRALLQVRDRLVREKRCTVYSPCLHEHGCPALVNPTDWCHEERAWEPPPIIRRIDAEVGFIKDALKFSYLLLRKDGKRIIDRRPDVYRVVSELRVMKGEKRAWLCNEQGRQEVGRQDRLASPDNAAFDQWHRGAIVQIEKISHKERAGKASVLGRIELDAVVEIVRSA